jgi:repressor LexA
MGLTVAQRELLTFAERYLREHGGVGPSFDEMIAGTGNFSKATIHRLLKALEDKKLIRRMRSRLHCPEGTE